MSLKCLFFTPLKIVIDSLRARCFLVIVQYMFFSNNSSILLSYFVVLFILRIYALEAVLMIRIKDMVTFKANHRVLLYCRTNHSIQAMLDWKRGMFPEKLRCLGKRSLDLCATQKFKTFRRKTFFQTVCRIGLGDGCKF